MFAEYPQTPFGAEPLAVVAMTNEAEAFAAKIALHDVLLAASSMHFSD